MLCLLIGTTSFGWPTDAAIRDIRARDVAATVVAGAALAASGVGLQGLLRNPLAEPFILGLSTGAAVGIIFQQYLQIENKLDPSPAYTGAVIGGLLTMTILFLAARRRGVIDPLGLLLTGVVLSSINGAIILLINYLDGSGAVMADLAQWMMGSVNQGVTFKEVRVIAVLVAICITLLHWQGRAIDIATLSDAEASSLGVSLGRLRTILFLTASLLATGAVVLCGPIAFVGLIAPHIARMLIGPHHRPLLWAAVLIGMTIVTLSHAAGKFMQLQYQTGIMPIGVFTAILGGPILLWMLRPMIGREE